MQPQERFGRPATLSLCPCPAALSPDARHSSDQSTRVPLLVAIPLRPRPGRSGGRQGARALPGARPAVGMLLGMAHQAPVLPSAKLEAATGISFWCFPVVELLFLFVLNPC